MYVCEEHAMIPLLVGVLNGPKARRFNELAHIDGAGWTRHKVAHLKASLNGPTTAGCGPNGLNLRGLRASAQITINFCPFKPLRA